MGVFPMKMCLRTLISVKDHGFAEKFEVINVIERYLTVCLKEVTTCYCV